MMPVETETQNHHHCYFHALLFTGKTTAAGQQAATGPGSRGEQQEPPGHYTLLTNEELFYQMIPSEGPDELESIQRSKVLFFPASTSNLDMRQ